MSNGKESRKKNKTLSGRVRSGWEASRKFLQAGFRVEGVPFYRTHWFLKGLLVCSIVLSLSFLLLPDIEFISSRYQIGAISPKNIKAPRDLDVPDLKATEEKRRQVTEETLSVYDFDLAVVSRLDKEIQDAFTLMNRYYMGKRLRAENEGLEKAVARQQSSSPASEGKEPQRTEKELLEEGHQQFEKILQIKVPRRTMRILDREEFSPELASEVGLLVKMVMNRGVVSSPDLLLKEADKGITIKGIGENFEKKISDIDVFLDLKSAHDAIARYSDPFLASLPRDTAKAVKEIASLLIVPNLTFNKNETELRKAKERDAVKTVYFKVQKGEMIVREGDRITERHMAKLNALNALQKENNLFQTFIGLVFFNAILLGIFLIYIRRFKQPISQDLQKLTLLGLIIVGSLGLIKAFYWIAQIVMANLEFVEPSSILFGIPFAFCGMMIGVLFEIRIFIFPILMISILSGMMIHEDLSFTLYALVGNVIAALTVQNCRRRSALLRGGMIVGGANVLTALSITILHNDFSLTRGLDDALFAFFGGLLVSVLVSSLVPLLESLFKITTDIRLLELSDTNQRVLKDLLVHAPGTYQHSLMVGNLAEEAAEAVGANSLLTRVSSLYHDIGKIQKAEYFVENQINVENRHDKLIPSMSALILISHIKDGVELARENKLPPAILDIIRQHHGSSLITYFFQKAKDQENPSIHAVKEEDFRYPGPKPQTKEAAIVMITDAVEAASRVLAGPNPSRIEGMVVNKILERIYLDGQLDECDLTLKDLREIKRSLLPILTSIHHHRIDYPSVKLTDENGENRKDENPAQPAGNNPQGPRDAGDISLEKSLRNRPQRG
ncbi:MAG: HDIG domain-containing protein [Deltaproteobacteria bacterium]|nr:HDIG domain-containing protein [Deltaproteobacteria bacterium]